VLVWLDGFLMGGGLIVAIGAQNAFVIRQGLTGRFVFWICLFCACSDALLIWSGVYGLSAVTRVLPLFIPVLTYGGIVFLIWFGVGAVRRALAPVGMTGDAATTPSLRAALLACAAFTFLNPHVYLDTVVLLGSVANAHPAGEQATFAAGATTASFLWFFSIGFGAMVLKPWFDRPRVWQMIDGTIALIMFGLAAKIFLAS
jgi:L-lysine exporter family protein LysE/ArgO